MKPDPIVTLAPAAPLVVAPAGPGGWKLVIAHDYLVPVPASIAGTWRGSSTCVRDGAHPACKDEVVAYRFKGATARSRVMALDAEKIVGSKVVPMYSIDVTYDAGRDAWMSEFTAPNADGLWWYVVRGDELMGTLLDVPSKYLVRHVYATRN